MNNILNTLFDYQKFNKNKRLSDITDKYSESQVRELNEDELSAVNAAGNPNETGHLNKKGDPNVIDCRNVNENHVLSAKLDGDSKITAAIKRT